jgi:hypothetical protein
MHQQKLIHITDFNNVGFPGFSVITHGLHLSADQEPALAVAPINFNCIPMMNDPSSAFRWWVTAVGTNQYTANWDGTRQGGVVTLRWIAQMYHSICYDYNYTERPY